MDTAHDQGFGLYLHWPFCQSKCPYCDFNSHVAEQIDMERWARAYAHEIDRVAAETSGRRLTTVFFGGGTPSLMSPDLVHAILDRVRARWRVANDWEVTLEANPGSVDAGRFRAFREAGVNRLSMGMQAMNDADLRRLGRLHTVKDAEIAFEIARDTIPKVSFDLIYARQDQTPEQWEAELSRALSMAVDHLSLYQLTIEDGTAFGDRHARGGLLGLPDDEKAASLYQITQDLCESAGLFAYEISNHAKPGAESQHNLIYWRGGDYLGVGPGAHGRLTTGAERWATEAIRSPEAWLNQVERLGSGELPREALSRRDRALEYLMMSLRLAEGLSQERFEAIAGVPLDAAAIHEVEEYGMLVREEDRLYVPRHARIVLNAIVRRLASDL